MISTTTALEPGTRGRVLGSAVRGAMLIGGLLLIAFLVRSAGPERVFNVMHEARSFFPLVAGLEIGVALSDLFAARVLLGRSARAISWRTWLCSTSSAYAAAILLPAGRAAGEATRAVELSRVVGAPHAASACSHLQACALLANAAASTACAAVATASGAGGALGIALLINAAVCATLGAGLLALAKNPRLASWLRRRFHRFVAAHPTQGSPKAAGIGAAIVLSLIGRTIQAVQYGVIVYAVGGSVGASVAVTALGIHLVGAAVGDLIPNQMGATEGAYRAFARALGFAGAPARALSVALVARATQITLALLCLVASAMIARQARSLGVA